ncbi:cytochrome c/c1 heme-lyase [Hygrophoropsis aurantiaca]|uniref:Cytochrome c/c1 heme-lyase n=1 Tax=Hygrophoropsis aurantiaca TaxID=72124 RepID=A0ACB8A5H4_9AGAM|nr:cytochrome c/c1 heme-lyase [Hygrophoropsis aurantiaca]
MGQTASASKPTTEPPAGCPMHNQQKSPAAAGSGCPIDHSASSKASSSGCPIDHNALSPLNQMPTLPQTPTSAAQSIALPTSRTESSIPREPGSRWEYPSPQQFYNALVRKGWETPEQHVETMVDIHNFLNERAWGEVLRWEKRSASEDDDEPYLARFKGRPGEMSPKARLLLLAGWLLPSRFNTEPPFDRHDWIVRRPKTGEEVRYVIDYYSAPDEPDGSPVFSLDVRPALDSFGSVKERIVVATEEAWASFREDNTPGSSRLQS